MALTNIPAERVLEIIIQGSVIKAKRIFAFKLHADKQISLNQNHPFYRRQLGMALISIHFDDPITVDHKVPIRTLATTYAHLQRAIDRSFLIETYGDVYKHQRLTADQYAETVFLAEYPREGGIILDAVRNGAEKLVDRIASSIRPVIEKALNRATIDNSTLAAQFRAREAYVRQMEDRTPQFRSVVEDPPPTWKDAYSNRSVVKEIDQLVT